MLKVINHSLLKKYISIIRDENTNSAIFSKTCGKISEILLYELLKNEPVKSYKLNTPVEKNVDGFDFLNEYALIPILRAGLIMIPSAREILPNASVMHIGAMRDEKTFEAKIYLNKLVKPTKEVHAIVFDPMLATGGSAIQAIKMLQNKGYKKISFIGIIGVKEGVEALEKAFGKSFLIYLANLDPVLDSKKYIHPGLGDAGDRAFNTIVD